MRQMETFVVRIFVPATPEPHPLCGLVERVATSETTRFEHGDQLLALLDGALPARVSREPSPADRPKGDTA